MSNNDPKHDWHEIARRSRMMLQDCELAMCGAWVALRDANVSLGFDVMEQLMEMKQTMDLLQDFLAETPNPKYEE